MIRKHGLKLPTSIQSARNLNLHEQNHQKQEGGAHDTNALDQYNGYMVAYLEAYEISLDADHAMNFLPHDGDGLKFPFRNLQIYLQCHGASFLLDVWNIR